MNQPSQSAVLFAPGQIVATPGALQLLEQNRIQPITLLSRHLTGDWGDIDTEDAKTNDEAVKHQNRILSSYPVGKDKKVWIITEWDRSVTTILLPEDY